jgi:hypothetical protein
MLNDQERHWAGKAIGRTRLFLNLSIAGVVIALGLAVFYAWQAATQPGFAPGIHAVLVLLILLNARQNLRQYRYTRLLKKLGAGPDRMH